MSSASFRAPSELNEMSGRILYEFSMFGVTVLKLSSSKDSKIDDGGLGSARRRKFPGVFRTPRSGNSVDELPSTDGVTELAIFHCKRRCGLGDVKVCV